MQYRFRPENKWLVAYGPNLDVVGVWDRDRRLMDYTVNPWFTINFARSSMFSLGYLDESEQLRPGDAPNVATPIDFPRSGWMGAANLRAFPKIGVSGWWHATSAINLHPVAASMPAQGPSFEWQMTVTLQPVTPLRIDTTMLASSLRADDDRPVFDNRILRLKVNWQITRELAVRAILQHERTVANATLTTLEPARYLNTDLLVSYIINPWTAIYAGYNGNARDLDDPRHQLQRDAQQLFAKVSYLYRF
jgi:hypothetical protein